MTVIVTKDAINLREKLSELDKETGIKGEEIMRADTSAEAREALQLDQQLFTDFESTGIDDNATSTAITIDSSENVGIGTSIPSAELDVIGDIEVSGGVYLGGTAEANKLDDYEEGSWTPIFSPQSGSFSAITMTNFVSSPPRYTKVGNLVTIDATIETQTLQVGTGSGYVNLSGLPFAASNAAVGSISAVTGFAGEEPLSVYVEISPTDLFIVYRSSVSGADALLQVSDLTTGTGLPSYSNYFIISITYRTTA